MRTSKRIVVNNAVHFGQPCLEGTRIPVYCVLELVQANVSFNEIVTKYYPDITVEDIKTCVGSAGSSVDQTPG